MNRNVVKTWKKRGRRKRSRSCGNPNAEYRLASRWGNGRIKRRDKKVVRRNNRKKRLPDG